MSYDPFAQPRQQQHSYHDSADFNPYSNAAPPPHASYEQGGAYKDEAMPVGGGAGALQAEDKEFDPFQPPPKSTGDLRMWRQDHHGNLWTKGGRGRCIGRFCCCTIMVAILLLVSIVLTLAIFLRPPDIQFGGVSPSTTSGSAVEATSNDLKVNLGIGISVSNPNFFTVTFKSIKAVVTYPVNDTQIGGGTQNNVVFKSNSKTSFTFPFLIEYSQAKDPQGQILTDIATKCGFMPGTAKKQLSVKYQLTLAIQILFVTIAPPISGTANFDCPFSLNDIKPLVQGIPALSGILGGGG